MNTREFVTSYRRLRKQKNNDRDTSYEKAREEVEEFFSLIGDIVAMDEEVKFKNKGIFSLKKRKKRNVRNLYTREITEIDPGDTIKFAQSKVLEEKN